MNERARHFPLFDSLRAIAFLAVLTTHAAVFANLEVPSARLAPFYARLDVGVDVFFVISAFLLYRPFVAARVDPEQPPLTRSFAWRRFLRVAPPYWLALTVVGLWIGAPSVFRLSHIPWFYGFAQIYNPDTFSLEGLPQAWSLCVEASFYIFLPLWAFGMRRVRGRTRAARVRAELIGVAVLVAFGIVYNAAIGPPPGGRGMAPHFALPAFIDYFALGMGLAVLSVAFEGRRVPAPLRAVERFPVAPWAVALLAFVAVSKWIGLSYVLLGIEHATGAQNLGRHLLYGVVALGLVLPAVFGDPRRGVVRRILATRVLLYIGMVSYMAYLLEFAVMVQLQRWHFGRFAAKTSPYMWFVVAAAMTIAIASVSWYLFEKPILRFKRLVPARAVERGEATLEPTAPAAAAIGSGGR